MRPKEWLVATGPWLGEGYLVIRRSQPLDGGSVYSVDLSTHQRLDLVLAQGRRESRERGIPFHGFVGWNRDLKEGGTDAPLSL